MGNVVTVGAAIGRPPGIAILIASFIRNTFRVLSLRAANGRPYDCECKFD